MLSKKSGAVTAQSSQVTKGDSLKKNVAAIHTSGELTLLERKLSNALLLNAYEKLLTARTHRVPLNLLCEMLGYNSHDIATVKAALKRLATTAIEFNVMEDGKEVWRVMTMISFGEIKDGICTYRYDEYLAERLYDPEIYATINMSIQRQFQSGYALTLYENCLRYKDVGSTGWWDLEKFRRVMGASATFYDEFKYLQRDVIKGPVKQVNETSDIRIEPDFERQARKVTKIRFLITDPLQKSLVSKKDIDADAEIRNSDIFKQLSEHGIGEALAIDWIRSEPARIVAIIADVEAKHRQGKVKSTGGYITQMVKIGATPGATAFEKKKRESQLAKAATLQQSVNQEEQEQERVRQDLLRAEQWLESQSSDAQKLTVDAWFDQANEFEKRNYKKNPDGIVSRKNIARHILKSNVMDR